MQTTKRSWSVVAPAIGFALASLVATDADARGIMIINTGEDVMKVADIDPQVLAELTGVDKVLVRARRIGVRTNVAL